MTDRTHWWVAVDVAGVTYRVTVFVYPTRAELMGYLTSVDPKHEWSPAGLPMNGAFWANNYALRRRLGDGMGGSGGVIVLAEDAMTVNTIAHESAHAAQHIYMRRFGKYSTKLLPHMHGSNEAFAYLLGDLAGTITRRVLAAGMDISSG